MRKSRPHTLVLRFSALGDVAMTIPAIYSVAGANPERDFTVATTPFFSRLFINPPANVKILPVAIRDIKGLRGWSKLFKELAATGVDSVADLHNVSRTWAIDTYFRLRGKRVEMVDKKRSQRKKALSEKLAQESFVARYVDVFRRLGLKMPEIHPSANGPEYPPCLPFAGLDLSDRPLTTEFHHPVVGIAPVARYYTKTYPVDMLEEVIPRLTSKGIEVILFGGRGEEAAMLGELSSRYPGCRSIAGKFALEDELRLMQELDVMVSMDSANQHLASLVGTRVVTIWGATTPLCGFAPYGQQPSDSLLAGVDCQPCSVAGGPECPRGNLACMRRLSPRTVAEIVAGSL